jgi:hypothetical protein
LSAAVVGSDGGGGSGRVGGVNGGGSAGGEAPLPCSPGGGGNASSIPGSSHASADVHTHGRPSCNHAIATTTAAPADHNQPRANTGTKHGRPESRSPPTISSGGGELLAHTQHTPAAIAAPEPRRPLPRPPTKVARTSPPLSPQPTSLHPPSTAAAAASVALGYARGSVAALLDGDATTAVDARPTTDAAAARTVEPRSGLASPPLSRGLVSPPSSRGNTMASFGELTLATLTPQAHAASSANPASAAVTSPPLPRGLVSPPLSRGLVSPPPLSSISRVGIAQARVVKEAHGVRSRGIEAMSPSSSLTSAEYGGGGSSGSGSGSVVGHAAAGQHLSSTQHPPAALHGPGSSKWSKQSAAGLLAAEKERRRRLSDEARRQAVGEEASRNEALTLRMAKRTAAATKCEDIATLQGSTLLCVTLTVCASCPTAPPAFRVQPFLNVLCLCLCLCLF